MRTQIRSISVQLMGSTSLRTPLYSVTSLMRVKGYPQPHARIVTGKFASLAAIITLPTTALAVIDFVRYYGILPPPNSPQT
jgi:hypothetical protein